MLNYEKMSYDTVTIEPSLSCGGHSCVSLDDDCLLVCGGYKKLFFVYTSKQMIPGACDLGEACDIVRSSETSPLAWIQCEGKCQMWIHQFCAGVLNHALHGKFVCTTCKKGNRKRKL